MKFCFGLLIVSVLMRPDGCVKQTDIVHGYAYGREILPGMKPSVTLNEDGRVTKQKRQPQIEYYIYLETKDSSKIFLKNVWVKGITYWASLRPAMDLPITISNPVYDKMHYDTLISSSRNFVWQVILDSQITSPGVALVSLKRTDLEGVAIEFSEGTRSHHYSIKKIHYLEPIRLQ
ncbi:MAG: hypothetical protein ABIR19_03515 [Ginsengibacter sp.]